MSEAEGPADQPGERTAAVLPIREGLELVADVQREALDYFKDRLAAYGGPDMIGVCFTVHDKNGRCTSFSYAAPDRMPNALLEAQASVVLADAAIQGSSGQ